MVEIDNKQVHIQKIIISDSEKGYEENKSR